MYSCNKSFVVWTAPCFLSSEMDDIKVFNIVIRETAILPTTMVSSNDEWCTSQDYVSLNTKKKERPIIVCMEASETKQK